MIPMIDRYRLAYADGCVGSGGGDAGAVVVAAAP
jgi:hypothetical protein